MLSKEGTVFFYSLIILGATLFASLPGLIKNNRVLKYVLWSSSFMIAWIPAALRFGTGADYFSYIRKYYDLTYFSEKFLGIIKEREAGFYLLNFLVKWTIDNPQYVIAISSFLFLIFIYMMLHDQHKNINVGLAMFIFMTLFYFASYNILRQYIAMGIVFYAFKYLAERNFSKFTLCIVFAASFHLTALVVLPIYFLGGQHKNIKLVAFVGAIVMIFISYGSFLETFTAHETLDRYSHYTADAGREFGLGQILIRLPILLPLLFYKQRIISLHKEYEIFFSLIIIDPFLGMFTYITPNANRIGLYFSLVYILLLAAFPKIFKWPYSFYASAYVAFYCIAYWIIYYIYRGVHGTIPYQF